MRQHIDEPIAIRRLQQFAVDYEMQNNLQVLDKTVVTKEQKVACVGSGPASLACAAKLAQAGYQVEIFEASSRAGGMLSFGIPAERLAQEIVDFDVKTVADLGVKIHLNTKVGRDISLAELEQNYAAVFIGAGLWGGRKIDLGQGAMSGVVSAMDFLPVVRANGTYNVPEDVVVIGAGDTGMDCASTAKQYGAKNVTILCNEENIPAYHEELEAVQQLGVTVLTNFTQYKFIGADSVNGVIATHANNFTEIKLKADLVIWAIGQQIESPELYANLKVNGNKLVVSGYQTSNQKFFAAGDAANGGSTVVQAVHEGKEAAKAIIEFLVDGE
ncbi:MAG: dihydropyrimidine dehydrogenase [Proteobacteria bacterium]|nr:MAG: dihydropyrimidine dehydrogenase [Pseudomonadota bacterium]